MGGPIFFTLKKFRTQSPYSTLVVFRAIKAQAFGCSLDLQP